MNQALTSILETLRETVNAAATDESDTGYFFSFQKKKDGTYEIVTESDEINGCRAVWRTRTLDEMDAALNGSGEGNVFDE